MEYLLIYVLGWWYAALAQAFANPDWGERYGHWFLCASIWFIYLPALLIAGIVCWCWNQIAAKIERNEI